MKILALSDIHEEEVALQSLVNLSAKVDHIFICGDTSRTNLFAESVLKAFPNCFVIPGNWENEQMHKVFSSGPQWINEKRVEIENGLNIVGFGYSNPTPFNTFGELSEGEIYKRISKLPIDENTILMLHCPPKGYFDIANHGEHAGSESILAIVREKKPLAALFGHIHEQMGIQKLGPTTLVKLPAAQNMCACFLSIEDRKINAEFISL